MERFLWAQVGDSAANAALTMPYLCMRHKCIIKKLAGDRQARNSQLKELSAHLRRQYADRVVYWHARANSRLQMPLSDGFRSYCLIVDGLDHAKFKVPRSRVFASKEFAALHRPVMDFTGILVHGCAVFGALSEQMTPKDSSLHVELFYHSLHRLSEIGHDFRQAEVILQSDNTCRESKNSTMLRAMSLLVGTHRPRCCELRNLSATHSHEDIDQCFSILVSDIQAAPELHIPEDSCALVTKHLGKPENRPYEKDIRQAFILDTVRDWTPSVFIFLARVVLKLVQGKVGKTSPIQQQKFKEDLSADRQSRKPSARHWWPWGPPYLCV